MVADAAFLDAGDRAGIAAAAAAAGVPFTGLWLTAPLAVLRARVAARQGDASDATVAVLEAAAAAQDGAPPGGWIPLEASGDPLPVACAALGLGG